MTMVSNVARHCSLSLAVTAKTLLETRLVRQRIFKLAAPKLCRKTG